VRGSKIMFTDYTSAGNNICITSLDDAMNNIYVPVEPVSYLINRFDIEPGKTADVSVTDYTPKPYRKWQHLFGIHSWMPFYADIEAIQSDLASVRPGFTVMSQNQLSTLTLTTGYEYSVEKRNLFHTRISWKGWYPVFDSEFDFGNIPMIYKRDKDPLPGVIMPGYQFINTVSLPLTISSGRFSQFMYFSGSANFQNDYLFIKETSKYSLGLTQFTGRFFFNNYYMYALRDIYPKWAQVFDVIYSWHPFEKDYLGSIFTARTAFYFPGLINDNGLRIRFETDLQHPEKYYTGNRSSFSRSYENITSMKTAFLSVDYVMPLAYPDFNISSILYLKRIRSGLFYDYTRGKDNYVNIITDSGIEREFHGYAEEFKSFGFELLSDFYILRIPYMISAGVQTTWRSFNQTPYFRFLFNINIYGMNIGRRSRL
jgi:hypothetical protein